MDVEFGINKIYEAIREQTEEMRNLTASIMAFTERLGGLALPTFDRMREELKDREP